MLAGCEQLIEQLEKNVNPAEVRVMRAPCMGGCDVAPAVRAGNQEIGSATLEGLQSLIEGKNENTTNQKWGSTCRIGRVYFSSSKIIIYIIIAILSHSITSKSSFDHDAAEVCWIALLQLHFSFLSPLHQVEESMHLLRLGFPTNLRKLSLFRKLKRLVHR